MQAGTKRGTWQSTEIATLSEEYAAALASLMPVTFLCPLLLGLDALASSSLH